MDRSSDSSTKMFKNSFHWPYNPLKIPIKPKNAKLKGFDRLLKPVENIYRAGNFSACVILSIFYSS